MTSTTEYQESHNGPLKQQYIDFLNKVRIDNHLSYKTLGEQLGCSGAFAHAILNKPSNITTATAMQRVAQGIERLGSDSPSALVSQVTKGSSGMLDHTYHLRSGMAVNFRLPEDLTDREVERLSMFIQSLSL